MKVAIVFPDVPRAVFTTALGWYRAIMNDPEVSELCYYNANGYYGLSSGYSLESLSVAKGIGVTLVVSGHQVFQSLSPGSVPGDLRALVLTDEPYETKVTRQFNSGAWSGTYDAVLCNDSSTVSSHQASHFFPCAFDSAVKRDATVEKMYDIGFIGTTDERREEWLDEVDKICKGGSWCLVGPKRRPRNWERHKSYYSRIKMNTLPGKGYLSPEEVARYYGLCRIVLNVHRGGGGGGGGASSPNPRTYDLLGYGVPAVQDSRKDSPESVIQTSSPAEMAEFVQLFLSGDQQAQKRVAEAVASGILSASSHSYEARWARLKQLF